MSNILSKTTTSSQPTIVRIPPIRVSLDIDFVLIEANAAALKALAPCEPEAMSSFASMWREANDDLDRIILCQSVLRAMAGAQ